MIHRALFGSVERFFAILARALRRRVPGLARAGAGRGAAGRRPPRRLRVARSRDRCWRPTASGSRCSTRTTTRSATASAGRRWRRCPYVLVVGDDDVEHGTVGVNARGSDAARARRRRRRLRRPPRGRGRRTRRTPDQVTLERLWAGWRSDLHRRRRDAAAAARRRAACLFERLRRGPDDEAMVLARNEHAFAVMNAYPYTSGHLMVAPLRHVATLAELSTPTRPPR